MRAHVDCLERSDIDEAGSWHCTEPKGHKGPHDASGLFQWWPEIPDLDTPEAVLEWLEQE